jgi:ATP-dependent DNA helicase DinG
MSSRFTASAAEALREAIRDAGGVEVFAIGEVEGKEVTQVTITCRGTEDSVPALLDRPRAGQVVIHNHPSGDLRPSQPDLQLAHLYGEDGVGVVIVDSAVTRSNWVVEPHVRALVKVDEAELRAFFTERLPKALPGWEARPQQIEMALNVARSLDEERPLLCEAGTGTGKSLAYLVPAALWARANDAKVVVSTFTRALQGQLVASDLPLLAAGGLDVKTALLQGRTNYACRRRLQIAVDEALEDQEKAELKALLDWSNGSPSGSRSDLPMVVDQARWEQVQSESDLTLSVRCPHYLQCHYYKARRNASSAHLIVVNHALLLADLSLQQEAGRGFLPKFQRIVLDEAHHLEDAATGASTERLSALAVRRAVAGALDGRRRKGALGKLAEKFASAGSALSQDRHADLLSRVSIAEAALDHAATGATVALGTVADVAVTEGDPKRVTSVYADSPTWTQDVVPTLLHLESELHAAAESLDKVEQLFQDLVLPEEHAQPLLDVRRARRRLVEQAKGLAAFVEGASASSCRWIDPERTRTGERTAAVCAAPIEVSAVLARILWAKYPGTACTSATLTVAGRFEHLARRIGLPPDLEPVEVIYPSPFDHEAQALLGLPRDVVAPDDPGFLAASAKVVVDAIRISDGGAFVLCTSYAAVKAYADAVRRGAGDRPVLVQGEGGRSVILQRFRENRRAVLIGTDSFWEGVSVRGEGLRLVIIPRIPFRVPTEPLLQARHERIASRGGDPFKALSLPEAVLKLRQGYGRLIRSHTDRGAVLLLDRRIHDKSYGTVVLRSLPPARRVIGSTEVVLDAVRAMLAPAPPAGLPLGPATGRSSSSRS